MARLPIDPKIARILLSADPLYAVPVDMLFKELHAEIETDPALSEPREETFVPPGVSSLTRDIFG